jgi:hypothetical protein
MPHEISSPTGLKYSEILAIFTILQAEGFCKNSLLIYHNCDPDTPMKVTPFEDGLPQLPCVCEYCQEEIYDMGEFSFDVMAKLINSVEFI